jgi:hypothetical protein
MSTSIASTVGSLRKLEWAVVSCSLPLNGRLLLRAAQSGQLELLRWLRNTVRAAPMRSWLAANLWADWRNTAHRK